MKNIMMGTLALCAAFAFAGCGDDDCTDGANRILAVQESCGFEVPDTDGGDGDGGECTEAAGALAQCVAECYEAADCAGVPGATDFDATSQAAMDLNSCVAMCN
jgi:hypothetical protein